MSNVKRQRRFQERHPGYDARRKVRQRAGLKRVCEALRAERRQAAMAERMKAEMAGAAAVPAPMETSVESLVIPVPTTLLALPSPVELPVLPAINDLDALARGD